MAIKKLSDLFRSKGLLFPTTEKEIEEFEKEVNVNEETPVDWDNPSDIIKRGKLDLKNSDFSEMKISPKEIQNLAMAARDGKEISEKIRKKMKNDKDESKK